MVSELNSPFEGWDVPMESQCFIQKVTLGGLHAFSGSLITLSTGEETLTSPHAPPALSTTTNLA